VATAGATLPMRIPGLRNFALGVWVAAALLLAGLLVVSAFLWFRHPHAVRSHGQDPVMAQFYGAPPMALLTVGAGAILVGRDLLGLRAAVDLDWVLWAAGTVSGLASAVVIPYRLFTVMEVGPDGAFGGWLMPIG
jgi:tellurite resistance protein TehA-like permease